MWERVMQLAVSSAVTGLPAVSATAMDRDALGTREKYRILIVTHGTLPIAGSHRKAIAEEYFPAAAESGFNVIGCSAKAPFDLDRVRREADWARKHGLYYVRWMRGKTGALPWARASWERACLLRTNTRVLPSRQSVLPCSARSPSCTLFPL